MSAASKIIVIGNEWVDAGLLFGQIRSQPEIISLPEDYPVKQLDFMGKFNLLVINLNSNHPNTLENLETIRANYPSSPILGAISDQTPASFMAQLQQAGVTGWLLPMFEKEAIVAIVNNYLEKQQDDRSFWDKIRDKDRAFGIASPFSQGKLSENQVVKNSDTLSVRFLGPMGMRVQGKHFNLPSGSKLRSLLALLLYESPKKLTRYQLVKQLWPDIDTESSGNNLSVTLHHLRKAIKNMIPDQEVIQFEQDRYFINPSFSIQRDVEQFNSLYFQATDFIRKQQTQEALAICQQAIEMYQGDFLEDLMKESWAIAVRDTLSERYITLMEHIGQEQIQNQNYGAAIETYRRILSKDDCIERAFRQIIFCLKAIGKTEEALRQYRSCAQTLREKMNRIPEKATTDLVGHLL